MFFVSVFRCKLLGNCIGIPDRPRKVIFEDLKIF